MSLRLRVVFEHWDLPALGLTRLEYLAADLSGHELLPDVAGVQETPEWSPDGTHLAFAGFDLGGSQPESIWETDGEGSTPRLLSTDCLPPDCLGDRDPVYSPDGRSIAFVRTERSGSGSAKSSVIAIRDLVDGSVIKLEATRASAPTVKDRHPSWSPDGLVLAFATITTGSDGVVNGSVVSVIGVDGAGLRQLAPTDLAVGDPTWSPDGSVILLTSWPIHEFEVRDVPAVHLHTIKPDGSGLRQLDLNGGSGAPSWSGDGSQILFTKMLGFTRGGMPDLAAERPNLMVMNRDGTGVQPVTAFGKCCRWYWVQQPTP